MKKRISFLLVFWLLSISLSAQVGIGTTSFVPDSAMLEVKSGGVTDPRGFLMPVYSLTQEANRKGADGLLYYSTDRKKFIYNNATNWLPLNPWMPNADGSRLLYNPGLSFRVGIGTADPQSMLDVNGTITSTGLQVNGAITSTTISSTELVLNGTGAVKLPVGSTLEQPTPPSIGMVRFNNEVRSLEYFDGTVWVSVLPPGTIVPFAGANVPSGWLLCNGASVSRAEYSALFAAIDIAWGAQDLESFNVPDLRGRFLRGADQGQGNDPDAAFRTSSQSGGNEGDAIGSYQNSATSLPVTPFATNTAGNHDHFIAREFVSGLTGLDAGQTLARVWVNIDGYRLQGKPVLEGRANLGLTSVDGNHSHSLIGGDSESRPKNVYVNYIIKY